jgi:hypothetical protein
MNWPTYVQLNDFDRLFGNTQNHLVTLVPGPMRKNLYLNPSANPTNTSYKATFSANGLEDFENFEDSDRVGRRLRLCKISNHYVLIRVYEL